MKLIKELFLFIPLILISNLLFYIELDFYIKLFINSFILVISLLLTNLIINKKLNYIINLRNINSIKKDYLNLYFKSNKNVKKELELNNRDIKNMLNRFVIILDEFPIALIVTDIMDRIIDVNKQAIELYGYSYNDFMNLNYNNLKYRTKNKNIITHSTKDGKLFPIKILKKGTIGLNNYYLVEDISNTINHKKESELYKKRFNNINNLFNTFINLTPQLIWVKNLDLEFTYINSKGAKILFGVDDYKSILGKTDAQLSKHIASNYRHGFISNSEKSDYMVLKNKSEMLFNDSGYVVGKWIDLKIKKYPLFNLENQLIGIICIADNITENVQFKKRNRDISKIAKIGDWYKDLINNTIEWSDEMYAIYEIDKSNFKQNLDKLYMDAVHPDDIEKRKKYRDDLYNNKKAYVEYRIIINGKTKHTAVKGKAITDNKGTVIAFYGVQQDITELKMAEFKLKESEQKYNRLLDNAPIGIVSCELNGNIDYLNEKLITILESENLNNLKSINLLNDGLLESKDIPNLFKKSMLEDKVMTHEDFYITGKGVKKYYHFSVNPLKKEGYVYGAIGIVEDYTSKKEIEIELIKERNLIQKLIKTIPDPIYIKNLDHEYTLLNDAMVKLLNIDNIKLAIGTTDAKYFPKKYKSSHDREELILKKGESFNTREKFIIDNEDRWFNVKKVPLKNDKDEIIGLVGILNDITDLKKTQEQLESSKIQIAKRNKDLEESNEILENFAYTTSHDLKTPLRGINSFMDKLLLKFKELDYNLEDEKISKYIQLIKKSVYQMNSIIIDTLNYARINKDDLEISENNLLYYVNESIPTQLDDNVRIDIKIPADINIKFDKNQLIRMFQNFISNAIKFNSKKNKIIEIGFQRNINCIYVKDNGDGISKEYYTKIFNLFQRLHGSKIDGNGLGLAIVKRIIQRHNWKISVESKIGKGTTFKIYIYKK